MSKTNNKWYPYEQVGSYYRLVDGALMFCPMNVDGTRDNSEGEVDFDSIAGETGDYEKDGKVMTFVEYVRAIAEELMNKE